MRLIDADALIETLKNMASDDWNKNVHTSWATAFEEVIDMLEDAPTIEPENEELDFVQPHKKLSVSLHPERKNGKWIDITNDESIDYEYKCSECGCQMEE